MGGRKIIFWSSPVITSPSQRGGEEGEAALGSFEVDWVYTATVTNESLAGDKITVTAFDMPGNTGKQENVIPAH